ncbi:Histidine kinase-, DNA gyrase B-, and HSP90-like ATPase [Nitrosospira sp. Nsp18]|uniref:ATP-binding protein n=1 Tax=Nitrosospira sp. Nsp18 TaxID=1855334 RepID=UPI00088CCBB6|nr:ATP-binding protein [Nitrosospira sp. Nsp18]SDA09892.1 Histidine kinase-, DNA gyrase B-, and HSP90-like ATPase [Nitrosospira sp. Nsp18]
MSQSDLHFQVDSRLATLLSQEYSSSERALKELIDNAWDADAEQVSVTLPKPLSDAPIIISDDGCGMTEEELRRHYLFIARDPRSRRGDRTVGKNRLIKGRKGIGKFAGLMAASVMTLETRARGRLCGFTLRLEDLTQTDDIEHLNIAFRSESCYVQLHDTTITLTHLHQGMAFPDANKLRQVLLQDYGRQDDFQIMVDGKRLDVDDVSGSFSEVEQELPKVGKVKLRFAISDGNAGLRQPGIILRVDGKSVGKPGFFGLDKRDDFPVRLLRKLYGEVNADGLRDHITAGWDAPVENSELLMAVEAYVQPILQQAFEQQYRRDMQLAQARLQKAIQTRLAELPEHKRQFADRAIRKVLDKYYGEPDSKVEPIVFVLLEALERSDYRLLLEHIADSRPRDVAAIAEGLNDFGLAEMAYLVEQASARSMFLDQLEQLASNTGTSEAIMHKALERNLWVFGPEFSLFSTNITLKRQIEEYLQKKYVGNKADQRPDLLLNQNLSGEYLLIELKRPSHSLNHDDYTQAIAYRHDLGKHISATIRVLLIGGRRSPDFPQVNREPDVNVAVFDQLIATARKQLQWLLRDKTGIAPT